VWVSPGTCAEATEDSWIALFGWAERDQYWDTSTEQSALMSNLPFSDGTAFCFFSDLYDADSWTDDDPYGVTTIELTWSNTSQTWVPEAVDGTGATPRVTPQDSEIEGEMVHLLSIDFVPSSETRGVATFSITTALRP
jgi:hypothetical protein